MINQNKFLYACGSFLFSLFIVAILTFFPLSVQAMRVSAVAVIVLVTFAGLAFPSVGLFFTKLFMGWSTFSPGDGQTAAYVASTLIKDERDRIVYDLKSKIGILIIVSIIIIGLLVWRFPTLVG